MRDVLTDEEFRKAVADVAPLAKSRRAPQELPQPAPVARQRLLDEREVLREALAGPVSVDDALESGVELAYLRDGLPGQILRQLRRGHWVVQDHVDLHGMNRIVAAEQVSLFLRASVARGVRCVRIVHGKGLGSRNREPVLKHVLRKILPRRDDVLAFCQAPAAHGGSGATLVLLNSG